MLSASHSLTAPPVFPKQVQDDFFQCNIALPLVFSPWGSDGAISPMYFLYFNMWLLKSFSGNSMPWPKKGKNELLPSLAIQPLLVCKSVFRAPAFEPLAIQSLAMVSGRSGFNTSLWSLDLSFPLRSEHDGSIDLTEWF